MTDGPLSGWMRTLIGYVRSGEPDLTNRQMALLMLVYLTPGPHTVRGLASALGVSKPVVTRALNTLGASAICGANATRTTAATSSSSAPRMGPSFLKASSATSGQATVPPHGPQSAAAAAAQRASPPSPIADGGFPLAGPSDLPDPATHAYRQDLADVALAGRVDRLALCRAAAPPPRSPTSALLPLA